MGKKNFRNYENNTEQYEFYKNMYKNQTINLVKKKKEIYEKSTRIKMNIQKAISLLDDFRDPSDPDISSSNLIHAYQTAERIRKKYPDNKEFQIIGLIHDLGKILFLFNEENWSIVGDTYVLGCEFPKSIVYYELLKNSPDYKKYNKLGIYKEKCGIENLMLSYGHDEYLYNILKKNKNHKISRKYMNIIRFHSFYPWHTHNEYSHFMNQKDYEILEDIKKFNEFDLYSKYDDNKITDEIKKYYNDLLNEFFNGELEW